MTNEHEQYEIVKCTGRPVFSSGRQNNRNDHKLDK